MTTKSDHYVVVDKVTVEICGDNDLDFIRHA